MKKSDTKKSLAQENVLDNSDKHYIYDLVDTLNSFFRNHFDSVVKVESLIEHPFYIFFDGSKFSKLLSYALSLEMGDNVIHIYLRELDGMLNVLIGTKEGLQITNENEATLRQLAEDIGFSLTITEEALIISKEIEITEAIPLRAINTQAELYDLLYCAFFGNKERDQ